MTNIKILLRTDPKKPNEPQFHDIEVDNKPIGHLWGLFSLLCKHDNKYWVALRDPIGIQRAIILANEIELI